MRERHEDGEVVNELVALPTDGSAAPWVVASGHDFYAAPRLSPDGLRLAWLSWDHPQMPWDGTELWVAELSAAGELAAERRVAGGPAESVLQPAWGPDGRLHFVSDRSGWWNLYRAEGDDVTPLAPLAAEFAKPAWVFGLQNYDFLPDGRIAATFGQDGVEHLGLIDPAHPGVVPLPCELTTFSSLVVLGEQVAVIGGGAARAAAVALVDPESGARERDPPQQDRRDRRQATSRRRSPSRSRRPTRRARSWGPWPKRRRRRPLPLPPTPCSTRRRTATSRRRRASGRRSSS